MDRFFLELTSRWRLSYKGKPLRISGTKAKALVTFLALNGDGFQSRERLAMLLWPDSPPKKARASLRQLTLTLKNELGEPDFLLQTRNEIKLYAAVIETDIDSLISAFKNGKFDKTNLRQIASLPKALTELEEISEELSTWIRMTRDRMISQMAECLRSLYTDTSQSPRHRIRLARLAQELDPFDEDAVRALMASHTELNNSVAALRVYGDFFEMLETELDAEPSVETQDLAVAIKLAKEIPRETVPSAILTNKLSEVTVAVLPFEAAGTALPDYVVLGLLDHVTCQLATLRAPAVISSNSTRRFLGQNPEPSEIGRVLQATYAVSGAIRTDSRQAVISVQLARTSDNRVIWANRHICALADLYDVNIPIACEIVQVVSPSINTAELMRTVSTPVDQLEPYHLLLRAKDLIFQLSTPEFEKAGNLLKLAIELSPYFAPAHALLAEWYVIAIWQGWSANPLQNQIALESHLQKAISLSPGDGRALALWGHCQLLMHRRYGEAEEAFEIALNLGPNDAETLVWTVPNYAFLGQPKRGVEIGEKAMKLSPLDPFAFRNEHFLSVAYYSAGDYDRSAGLGLSSFRRAPNYASNIRTTIAALMAAGRTDEARQLVEKHATVEPKFSLSGFFRRVAFRSAATRQQFCDRLLAAGMPVDVNLTQD